MKLFYHWLLFTKKRPCFKLLAWLKGHFFWGTTDEKKFMAIITWSTKELNKVGFGVRVGWVSKLFFCLKKPLWRQEKPWEFGCGLVCFWRNCHGIRNDTFMMVKQKSMADAGWSKILRGENSRKGVPNPCHFRDFLSYSDSAVFPGY